MQNIYHLGDEKSHDKNLPIIYSTNFSQIKLHVFIIKLVIHCELWLCICELIFVWFQKTSIPTPMIVIWNSKGQRDLKNEIAFLRVSMKHNWKFKGGGRVQTKKNILGNGVGDLGVWIFSGTKRSKNSRTCWHWKPITTVSPKLKKNGRILTTPTITSYFNILKEEIS